MKFKISAFSLTLLISTLTIAQNDRLEYFPMHVGDEWHYIEFYYDFMTEETSEVVGFVNYKIIGDTVLNNGERYFIFQRQSGGYSHLEYNRIDTTDMRVYHYDTGSYSCTNNEFDLYNLNIQPDSHWIDCNGQEHQTRFDTTFVNDFEFIAPKITDYPFWGSYLAFNLTKGLGLTVLEEGSIGSTSYEYLVYAKIDNKVYESITALNTSKLLNTKYLNLYQNYPNPFNSETAIKFTIQIPGLVSLKIFDVVGREVETLVNGFLSSGAHTVKWDASDISSGLYFYQLQSKKETKSKKLLLIK